MGRIGIIYVMPKTINKIEIKCITCEKLFSVWPSIIRKGTVKYCSRICQGKGQAKSETIPKKNCLECGIKFFKTNEQGYKQFELKKYCSGECWFKNNVNYKKANKARYIEDRTKLRRLTDEGKRSTAYNEWRKSVWLRDSYKCKIADENCEGKIEAHHILDWTNYPELRYQINNGITLCHAHHPRGRENEAKLSPYLQSLVVEI